MLHRVPSKGLALFLMFAVAGACAGCSSKGGGGSSSTESSSSMKSTESSNGAAGSGSETASGGSGGSNTGAAAGGAAASGGASGSGSSKSTTGSGSSDAKTGSGSSTAGPVNTKVVGYDWRIVEIGGQAENTQSGVTLHVGTDGSISGNSGCNDFHATSKISGHQIHFGPIASTKKACEPALMSQEQRLFEELGKVTAYSVDEKGDLHLTDAGGTTIVRLERVIP